MTNGTEREAWLQVVAVFCETTTAEASGALMRRAVSDLIRFDGVGFLRDRDRAILDRLDDLAPEWSNRPVILTDTGSAYSFMVDHFWDKGAAYHYLTAGPGSSMASSEIVPEWARLLQRAESLVRSLAPDFAVAFGKFAGSETDPVDYSRMCPGKHRVLTSWTYLKTSVSAPDVHMLSSLTGAEALQDGFIIRMAPRPGTRPAAPDLEQLARSTFSYIDPLLEED
jgi:hypothetical protein